MPTVEFPQRHLVAVQELAARLLETTRIAGDLKPLARQLLLGFYDICTHAGLDRVLADLQSAASSLEIDDRSALADHERVLPALVAQLGAIDLDGGGPRNAKPRQIAECMIAALELAPTEEADRTIALDDAVRAKIAAALASVVDVAFAVPQVRDTVIAETRACCEERFLGAFDKLAAQLDANGMQLVKQPKVPIDALHAVQQILAETRNALVDRVGRAAIDRAKDVIAAANAEAAARLDLPITLRWTPRDVAIVRACDARVPKTPAGMAHSLFGSVVDLVPISWRAPERVVRTYAASQTFAVGDLIDHVKFGRGAVLTCLNQRIEVEFADGKHTLIHVAPRAR